jgi:1,4-dihydroxy-2-naphthoate octaprenyltransferase
MATFQSWVQAARLRTLPLALASIAMGGFVAAKDAGFSLLPVILAAITTLLLQILSNFANDLGDAQSGIDNHRRIGPSRMVQTGAISHQEMKGAVMILAVLVLMSGLLLVFTAQSVNISGKIAMIAFGLAAIAAAIKYTIGSKPYGYIGFGDLFVFLFFGWLAVAGTFYLATGHFEYLVLLPASASGLLSAGVLNINNMRDMASDRFSGKRTLVVSMGYSKALFYHAFLILVPFALLAFYVNLSGLPFYVYSFLLLLPLFVYDLISIFKSSGYEKLDPFLKRLALKTLLLTIVFGVLLNI